ncbi:MAG TPA: tetratricopeptide repeat protein [Burkholderiales bacterium]|nr:tetratricopeptide repeat protein [Burkholderiales bacterium]
MLQQHGQLDRAQSICREILTEAPEYFYALHLLGIIESQKGNAPVAAELIGRAIGVNPHDASAHANIGNVLLDLRRPEEALASYERALALKPDFAGALNGRGNALLDLKRREEALASYERALTHEPRHVEALNNRGNALLALERPEEALASYQGALALVPDFAGALNGRGNALLELKRPEEALASFERALALQPGDAVVLNNRGNALLALARPDEALASFGLALKAQPDYVDAINGCGKALLDLRRLEQALARYDRTLELAPHSLEALNDRGNVLLKLGRPEEALSSFDRALAVSPDHVDALRNRCMALQDLALADGQRHEDLIVDIRKLLAIAPAHDYARGWLLNSQLHCCDWADYDQGTAQIAEGVRAGRRVDTPFSFVAISESAADQLRCAQVYAASDFPAAAQPVWRGERYRHDRIRLAYLSADFREHVMATRLAELFEKHDRTRFEMTAMSLGPDVQSQMRLRLQGAFERFVDVRQMNDQEVAHLLRQLEIDIAVDLNGYTGGCRTGIFAQRAVPLQVSYLGFPGTMGTDYIDYVLADRWVIPEEEHDCYAEKVAYLPDSYQVNESRRRVAEHGSTRPEVGLAEQAFVFCSFNNNYKLSPKVFDAWMRLLDRVEGSVLWLFASSAAAARNLTKEAALRGVGAERLVFSEKTYYEVFLARHKLADLALDTLPYNGHATTSDALWAGLPVLTCLGTTFAGRVAASLLSAAGLPELITRSLPEYEALALELATHPARLADLRARLARNRATCPLFDTNRFRRHIESAYITMWERQQRGAAPASFSVQPVS